MPRRNKSIIRCQGISGSKIYEVSREPGYNLPPSEIAEATADYQTYLGSNPEVVSYKFESGQAHGPGNFFFVKNWFLNSIPIGYNGPHAAGMIKIGSVKYQSLDVEGVKGQNHDDPKAYFDNHVVVKYNSKIYDPSYGSDVFTSENEWIQHSIQYVGAVLLVEVKDPSLPSNSPTLQTKTKQFIWINIDPLSISFIPYD